MLKSIAPNLWCVDSVLDLPRVPRLPVRMVVAKLGDGSLWVHSPVRLDQETLAEIQTLGPVHHVVAPNRFHHLYMKDAATRFPEARLYGAPGLATKRLDLPFDSVLGDAPDRMWSRDFDQHAVAGAPLSSEVVFFHRPTKTLIVSDLFFNLRQPKGGLVPLITKVAGTYDRFAVSRFWDWFFIRDKGLYQESIKRVLGFPFERIVMAHGDIAVSDARGLAEAAAKRHTPRVALGRTPSIAPPNPV